MEQLTPTKPIAVNAGTEAILRGEAFRDTYDNYADGRGADRLVSNYDLLEDIGKHHSAGVPALTVCVPVAINVESADTVACAVDKISKAQISFGKPVDVTLWSNAKYRTETDRNNVEAAAKQNYDALRDQMAARHDQGITIRTALQVLPEPEATMSQLRANYMDAVAVDVSKRNLGFDHPVMWLDADTTALSKNAFEKVEAGVRNFDALFVHPSTKFSIDWAPDQNLAEPDAATKVVAINEIQRRQMDRNRLATNVDEGYFEESGLAFAIGTYMKVGGVDTTEPVDESHELITRAIYRKLELCADYRAQNGPYAPLPPSLSIIPECFLERHKRPPTHAVYIKESSISMSARRHYEKVKQSGALVLINVDSGSDDEYQLFTEMDQARSIDGGLIAAELPKLVDRPEAISATTKKQQAVVRSLIKRYLGDNERK